MEKDDTYSELLEIVKLQIPLPIHCPETEIRLCDQYTQIYSCRLSHSVQMY